MKKSLTESGLRSKGIDMRDKIKDIEYFNTFINEDLARVKKFSDKLENGEVKEDRILPVKSKVHDLKLGIMIAGYSKGDELTLLEEENLDLLAEWYNEDCGCYEAHKSKQNIYYGYWSFEAGAIAKILKINDTQLRDTQYYPYDMVHYKE